LLLSFYLNFIPQISSLYMGWGIAISGIVMYKLWINNKSCVSGGWDTRHGGPPRLVSAPTAKKIEH